MKRITRYLLAVVWLLFEVTWATLALTGPMSAFNPPIGIATSRSAV